MIKTIKHPALFQVWGILFCFVVWECTPRLLGISRSILPPFSEVIRQISSAHELLGKHVYITTLQTVIAFLIVLPFSIFMAIVSVESKLVGRLILQPMIAIQNVPKVAIVPLLVLWFGYGSTNKIATGVLVGFYPLFESARIGMLNQCSDLRETMSVLCPSRGKVLWHVTLPAAIPNILAGIRVSLSLCLIGVIVAQLAQPSDGLGYIISVSNEEFKTGLLFGGVLLVSAIGVILNGIIVLIEQFLFGSYFSASTLEESVESFHGSQD